MLTHRFIPKNGGVLNVENPVLKHEDIDIRGTPLESPNARRKMIQKILRDGSAWEEPTSALIAKISPAKRKFAKARLGNKAAKQAERMDIEGDELTGDAATVCRALSARILYLSMDRPE